MVGEATYLARLRGGEPPQAGREEIRHCDRRKPTRPACLLCRSTGREASQTRPSLPGSARRSQQGAKPAGRPGDDRREDRQTGAAPRRRVRGPAGERGVFQRARQHDHAALRRRFRRRGRHPHATSSPPTSPSTRRERSSCRSRSTSRSSLRVPGTADEACHERHGRQEDRPDQRQDGDLISAPSQSAASRSRTPHPGSRHRGRRAAGRCLPVEES